MVLFAGRMTTKTPISLSGFGLTTYGDIQDVGPSGTSLIISAPAATSLLNFLSTFSRS